MTTQTEKFVRAILSDTEGFAFVGFGADGHYNDNNKYTFTNFSDRSYPWPSGLPQLLADVEAVADKKVDVYICPYVMATAHRSKGNSVSRSWLHADLDKVTAALSSTLKAITVNSGSPGHSHLYLNLDNPVDGATHDRLLSLLRDSLGSDAKISDNDYLRLPGTINHKTGMLVEISSSQGNTWDVSAISSLLAKLARVRRTKRSPDGDRSLDIFNLIRVGRSEGLEYSAIYELVNSEPALAEKLEDVGGDDFERVWDKLSEANHQIGRSKVLTDAKNTMGDRKARKETEFRRLAYTLGQQPAIDREEAWEALEIGARRCGLLVPGQEAGIRRLFDTAWDEGEADPLDEDEDVGSEFFEGERLLVDYFSTAVQACGSLGVDPGGNFWQYNKGRWTDGEKEVAVRITKLLKNHYTTKHETNGRKYMTPNLPMVTNEPGPDHINYTNGMLDWKSLESLPHDPRYMSTVQLPIAWKPEATCPNFDQFVAEIMYPDAIELYWQILGYMLLSGNPLQRAILFLGSGSNGKGTTLRTLEKILGTDNVSHVTLDMVSENRFAAADMFGKLANIAGDINAGYLKKTEQFKMLTGDDSIRAEKKYKDGFNFTPWCTPIFSANEQFSTADHTYGFVRRWLPLVFPNRFEAGSAPNMESKFELEGISVKAVHALRRLMDNGTFSNPPTAQKAKEEFIRNIDHTVRWSEENTVDDSALPNMTGSNRVGTETERGVLYTNLRFWCEREGVIPLGRNRFYLKLRAMGYIEVRSESAYYFRGLRLQR